MEYNDPFPKYPKEYLLLILRAGKFLFCLTGNMELAL